LCAIRRRLGLDQARFQGIDALLISLAHLRDFFAQGFQIIVCRCAGRLASTPQAASTDKDARCMFAP